MKAETNTPGIRAARATQRANRRRHKKPIDPVIDPVWNRLEAEKANAALANSVIPLSWAVRTVSDPMPMRVALVNELHAVDGLMPIARERAMTEVIAAQVSRQTFSMVLLGLFAAIALLLAGIGIYGVMQHSVEQRTQEIGIRMALGADRGTMLRMVLREGMTIAIVGVGLGVGLAFGASQLLKSLLFGVKATDPLAFVAVAAVVMIVALVAAYIPARRAIGVEPAIALRDE